MADNGLRYVSQSPISVSAAFPDGKRIVHAGVFALEIVKNVNFDGRNMNTKVQNGGHATGTKKSKLGVSSKNAISVGIIAVVF